MSGALIHCRRRPAPRTTTSSNGTSSRFAISVEYELLLPGFVVRDGRLLVLEQDESLQHQDVHVSAHEAPVGVLGRADNRLAPNVERRVDDHRTAGPGVELLDDVEIEG